MAIRKLTEHTLNLDDVMTLLGIKCKYVQDVKMSNDIEHNLMFAKITPTLVITVVNK